jgi:hypothetical protein
MGAVKEEKWRIDLGGFWRNINQLYEDLKYVCVCKCVFVEFRLAFTS